VIVGAVPAGIAAAVTAPAVGEFRDHQEAGLGVLVVRKACLAGLPMRLLRCRFRYCHDNCAGFNLTPGGRRRLRLLPARLSSRPVSASG
jgi:hypothetical protein